MDAPDHILIVDDDAEIRSLLSQYLVKNGLRVTAVADGPRRCGRRSMRDGST